MSKGVTPEQERAKLQDVEGLKGKIRKLQRYSTNGRAVLFPDVKGDFVEVGAVLGAINSFKPNQEQTKGIIGKPGVSGGGRVTPPGVSLFTAEQERAEARKALDRPEGFSLYWFIDFKNEKLLQNAPTWLRNSLDREEQLIAKVAERDKEIQRLQRHLENIERKGHV